jgi:hypothetical protein
MPQLASLPTIPLRRNWESSESSAALVDSIDYGQRKVRQYRRSTIVKSDLGSLEIQVAIDNRDQIYNFLVSRAGKPFELQDAPGRAWRCLSFSFVWVSPGQWVFKAEFLEVGGKWI